MDRMDLDDWFQLDYAIKHDEECVANQKTKRRAGLLFVCFACISIILAVMGTYLFAVVAGVLAAFLLIAIFLQNRYDPKQYLPFVYSEGNPTPAILSKTDPLILYILADMRYGEAEPVYGLSWFKVGSLPGHAMEPGERVPCAAMYQESKERPQQFLYYRIHPYCWATDRAEHIAAWADAIPEFEWGLLKKSMEKYTDIEEGEILELRMDGTLIGRRNGRSERLNLVATPEMECAHTKSYPTPVQVEVRDETSRIYSHMIELAAASQVYEYFCEPDQNSFLMTAFNIPGEFLERIAQAKLPLQPEEIPMVVCASGMILTSFGIWQKGKFYGWEAAQVKVRHSSVGKLDISLCGQHAAIIPYKKQYYTEPVTDEELHALEIKHMTDFLEGLSILRADHNEERT